MIRKWRRPCHQVTETRQPSRKCEDILERHLCSTLLVTPVPIAMSSGISFWREGRLEGGLVPQGESSHSLTTCHNTLLGRLEQREQSQRRVSGGPGCTLSRIAQSCKPRVRHLTLIVVVTATLFLFSMWLHWLNFLSLLFIIICSVGLVSVGDLA